MEIVSGRIVEVRQDGFTVAVPYDNIDRMLTRRYDEVQIGLPDGR